MNGFSSFVESTCNCTEVAPAAGAAGNVAICVPPIVIVAPEMKEISPPLSVASIRAALSVMLEILLTSAESGPASCDELKLPVKLGGPPPAWNC